MDKNKLFDKAERLIRMHKAGLLGGEVMPEDANPQLTRESAESYLYFTLRMALNYQRSSYALWQGAQQTYEDPETRFLFSPNICLERSFSEIQQAITKYKLALQPHRHPHTAVALEQKRISRYRLNDSENPIFCSVITKWGCLIIVNMPKRRMHQTSIQ